MKNEPTGSTLSLAILGLIAQAPCSGYDVRKVFATTPMGHFSASPGAIYPALKRLEKEGLIRGTVDRAQTLRPRQVYSLTAKGRKALCDALVRPVRREDVIWHMDQLMLRFVFMGNALGRKATCDFLKDFVREVEAYVVELQGHMGRFPPDTPPYARLGLQHGIDSYRMNAQWARRALRGLQEGRKGDKGAEA